MVAVQSLKSSPTLTPQKTASTSVLKSRNALCLRPSTRQVLIASSIKHEAKRAVTATVIDVAKVRDILGTLSLYGVSRRWNGIQRWTGM